MNSDKFAFPVEVAKVSPEMQSGRWLPIARSLSVNAGQAITGSSGT